MRFIPHSSTDLQTMLQTIGLAGMEDLTGSIPADIRLKDSEDIWSEPGLSEQALWKRYKDLAAKNCGASKYACYLGGGAYDHFIPAVVDDLAGKPEFLTSYTQYQPESNQGMLQGLFEYQTLMCRLTGMDVSNASHYDGGTSLVEAAWMAYRRKKGKILYSRYLHPHYRKLLKTYFAHEGDVLCEISPTQGVLKTSDIPDDEPIAALLVQNPNFQGCLESIKPLADKVHDLDAILIASVYPVSLSLLEAPGNLGADIVVGEGQSLGLPLNFGGPYFGFMCVRKEWMRKMPGRIVGMTRDTDGKPGYVLTLQTREQHIRREKAVSNICTNQALCALRAGIYLSYLGDTGFQTLGTDCYEKAHTLKDKLVALAGVSLLWDAPFFNEFTIQLENVEVERVLEGLQQEGILGGINQKPYYGQTCNAITLAVTETKLDEDLDQYAILLKALVNA